MQVTFSNGETVKYTGKRDVKAAWAIIQKDGGEILATGFSNSLDNAGKTAEASARHVLAHHLDADRYVHLPVKNSRRMTADQLKRIAKDLQRAGYSIPAQNGKIKRVDIEKTAQRATDDYNNAIRELSVIEVKPVKQKGDGIA